MANNSSIVSKQFSKNFNGDVVNYTWETRLATGGFATVQLYNSSRKVVLKQVPLDKFEQNPKLMKLALNEAKILVTLSHPNVVRVFNTWEEKEDNELVLELEYCGGGSLGQLIRRKKQEGNRHFEKAKVTRWLAQLCLGIAYIHDMKIVHRDLKSDNVLLTSDLGTIKIADFGMAKLTAHDSTFGGRLGTWLYMAPEALQAIPELKSGPKVDVWSVGVIAFELATLAWPFQPVCPEQQIPLKLIEYFTSHKDNLVPEKNGEVEQFHSVELRRLIETKLLVYEQKGRADMNEVVADQFLVDEVRRLEKNCDNYVHEEMKRLSMLECPAIEAEMREKDEKAQSQFAKMEKKLKAADGTNANLAQIIQDLRQQLEKAQLANANLEKQLKDLEAVNAYVLESHQETLSELESLRLQLEQQ